MKKKFYKSGEKAIASGQYLEVGPRGGSKDFEITAVKDKVLPPTHKNGVGYMLIDPTKNGSGKYKK